MSNKKTINITISKKKYPMLYNLNKKKINDMCNDIFKFGYDKYFPYSNNNNNNDINNNKLELQTCISNKHDTVMQTVNDKTHILKSEIGSIKNLLQTMDMSKKLNEFEDILQELFGITKHSSKKGKLGEEIIYKMIKNKFKDCTLDETRNTPHSGDAILNIPKQNKVKKVLIEIKNYSRSVDTDEINKMKYDMINTNIKYGLFISLKSGYVGKKQLCIDKFYHKDKEFTMLFVPNVMDNINKIESSIILIDRIIDIENNNRKFDYSYISSKLEELDKVYEDCKSLHTKFSKMEDNIKQQIHDFYIVLKKYEDDLKKRINYIWMEISDEMDHIKDESDNDKLNTDKLINLIKNKKTKSVQILTDILKTIKKNNLTINCINNSDDENVKYSSLCWHFKNKNNIKGCIVKKGTFIEILIHKPIKTSITFDDNKKNKNKLYYLDNILKCSTKIDEP